MTTPPLDPRDEWRRRVWVALADLFLDTDVTGYYASIAETLAASPFTLEELHAILLREVRPVLAANLQCVAGEWAGFDEAWLIERIASRPFNPLARLLSMREEWNEIEARVRALREHQSRD